MKWKSDKYWEDTLSIALQLSNDHKVILTPEEFLNYREEFYPLDFYVNTNDITAFVLPKDRVASLPKILFNDSYF